MIAIAAVLLARAFQKAIGISRSVGGSSLTGSRQPLFGIWSWIGRRKLVASKIEDWNDACIQTVSRRLNGMGFATVESVTVVSRPTAR